MATKTQDLEAKLFEYTRKKVFKEKSRSLEEALEEALELVEKKEPDTDEEKWW